MIKVDVSAETTDASTPLSAQHQLQLLKERLDQQAQQTSAAVAQLLLLRDQLAAEQAARCEAQVSIYRANKALSSYLFFGFRRHDTLKHVYDILTYIDTHIYKYIYILLYYFYHYLGGSVSLLGKCIRILLPLITIRDFLSSVAAKARIHPSTSAWDCRVIL